jgi:hypothetical protein
MFKKFDENQWIDFKDFKKVLKSLNGILKPTPSQDLNTCNKKSKKKGFGFGKKSS